MATFNLTDQTNLFKINYYKKSENMYNSDNVLQGRVKKRYDFTGKQRFVATPMSFSGGVGSGTLPTANAANYQGAVITSKKVYATCEIEREAIKASANNEGAFVQATKETVQKTVESYMRNSSRILFGNGSGVLGVGDGTGAAVTGNGSTATPYLVTIADTQANPFVAANWEEKDFVNVVTGNNVAAKSTGGTAEVTLLEIVAVNPTTRVVSLVGTSARLAALVGGAAALAATDAIAMQNSYGNDPTGLDGVVNVSTGSLYGITVQRRWQSYLQDASGAGITTDLMNGVMLNIEKLFGKVPNMIMCSYAQFRNILALLEDQKVYNLPNRNLKGAMSFQGVEFMSTRGPVGIFCDRFCPDKRVYFLNDDFMEVHHRPDFGWFDDDGTVFLRSSSTDAYGARYGGYYQNYITPTAHGLLDGLAV